MRPTEYRVWDSRSLVAALSLLLLACSTVEATPLFDDDSVLEIRLSGPLGTIVRDKQEDERPEHEFVLSVGDVDIPVDVRVRGKSRTIVCKFPPLRLNFSAKGTTDTVFAGQDKLKLVTHCRSRSEKFENNTLEEFTAYRIFNEISDNSFRVRLLRIHYEDTDGKLKHLDRPYYGFLIESDVSLANRMGGEVAELTGVPYSRLDNRQTGLFYVFSYLIGNLDWSYVLAEDSEHCCHNVDLIRKDDMLYTIPYDFDFSGLVNASYAKVPDVVGTRRITQRVYRGYCKLPLEEVAAALDVIRSRQQAIMAIVENSPVAGDEDTAARVRYIGQFFKLAEDTDKLLREFDRACVGPR